MGLDNTSMSLLFLSDNIKLTLVKYCKNQCRHLIDRDDILNASFLLGSVVITVWASRYQTCSSGEKRRRMLRAKRGYRYRDYREIVIERYKL